MRLLDAMGHGYHPDSGGVTENQNVVIEHGDFQKVKKGG